MIELATKIGLLSSKKLSYSRLRLKYNMASMRRERLDQTMESQGLAKTFHFLNLDGYAISDYMISLNMKDN